MLEPVRILVLVGQQQKACTWTPNRPLILGRQEDPAEPLGQVIPREDFDRLAVLPFGQVDVSRTQVRIDPQADGRFQVENLKSANPIQLGPDRVLRGEHVTQQMMLPLRLVMANCQIDLESVVQTLSQTTRLSTSIPHDFRSAITTQFKKEETAEFVSFINAMTSAFQMAPDERTLCDRACDAIKQLLDVDGVGVFLSPGWTSIAGDERLEPHRAALDRVNHERRVTWRNDSQAELASTAPNIACYVAAPIVSSNEGDAIYAAIYAHRLRRGTKRPPLTEMQARLVELVACTAAASIVRMQLERQTSRFGGFFPPPLARRLIAGDDILQASKREVTLMFCDIRRFSAICESSGPELASEWVGDILSELSQCVQDFEGVLVDYIGDELLAMWGAPEKQPNHADLACRAALAMMEVLPAINQRWQGRIHAETQVGIGINSGEVSVGNTGSRQRFKYGPLGDAVNRASRVQGLTKHLRIPILLTGETQRQLVASYPVRRIGQAKVVNIEESLELFELIPSSREALFDAAIFEKAVQCLEQGQPKEAAELLRPHLDFHNPDYPTLLLFQEIIDRLVDELPRESYEWNFGTK